MLAVSRRNNERIGVTDLLVSGGGRFLQVLEGPVSNVLATFDRIRADPRHFACLVLSSRSVDQRSFGEWSMAYEATLDSSSTSIVEAVAQMTDQLADEGLKAEFRTFAEMHSRAA